MWADSEDFQSIQISSLMWEDHMPDFVLEALYQCLPSKEQEDSILNATPQPSPNSLVIPDVSGYKLNNHSHTEPNHTIARLSRSLDEGTVVCFR